MDLGIQGRRAIVCAASEGLGRACALALARERVDLVMNARRPDVLEGTAEAVRGETGAAVTAVAGDIATEAGRARVLAACPEPDTLINNAGGPPPGDFRGWGSDDWLRAVEANMLTPIFLTKATVDGMIRRRFGRIVNITTSGVEGPALYPALGLSIAARGGLTSFVAVLARQTVRHNVTVNGLLPGRFDTERLRANLKFAAAQAGRTPEEEAERARAEVPAGRFGRPDEFGAACACLCGAGAVFITGQNLALDGGAFPGLLRDAVRLVLSVLRFAPARGARQGPRERETKSGQFRPGREAPPALRVRPAGGAANGPGFHG
jgi:3-oxoacyl-[acyl-carrier protein] reductase